MNCEQAKSYLYDRVLENSPGSASNGEFDAHLTTCQACQGELAALEMTQKLMRQALPDETPARRIVFAAEEARATRAAGMNPLRFWQWSFAGAAGFAMLFAVLAVRRPAPVVIAPTPAPAVSAQATFSKAEVEQLVNQAVAASEERQKMQMANVLQTAAERMSDQLHYIQSTQTQVYKQTEQNRADIRSVSALVGVRQ